MEKNTKKRIVMEKNTLAEQAKNQDAVKEAAIPKNEPSKKIVQKSRITEDKRGQIILQNIIFSSKEHKLMVSKEFLDKMALSYISKRMKFINSNIVKIKKTKIPANYFKYCDEVEKQIDELIALEKYYTFKKPIPSVYKENYHLKKNESMKSLIYRVWKDVIAVYPISDDTLVQNMPVYDEAINSLLEFREYFSDGNLALIDNFYSIVHNSGSKEAVENEDSADDSDEPMLNI